MKNTGIAYLLWIPPLGIFGAHKFYLGRVGEGILYMCTLGFLFTGWLKDLFSLGQQVREYNAQAAMLARK